MKQFLSHHSQKSRNGRYCYFVLLQTKKGKGICIRIMFLGLWRAQLLWRQFRCHNPRIHDTSLIATNFHQGCLPILSNWALKLPLVYIHFIDPPLCTVKVQCLIPHSANKLWIKCFVLLHVAINCDRQWLTNKFKTLKPPTSFDTPVWAKYVLLRLAWSLLLGNDRKSPDAMEITT